MNLDSVRSGHEGGVSIPSPESGTTLAPLQIVRFPAYLTARRNQRSFALLDADMTADPDKAIVLLSGGLDSTTTLAIARDRGYECYALTFRYGQRHEIEVDSAQDVAKEFGVAKHIIADLDLRLFGGSALTDDIDVPKSSDSEKAEEGIPVTYVPARNTIFLSVALGWAEKEEADDIFIGVSAIDYSGYPDCRPEFIESFEKTANLATKAGVEGNQHLCIHTPLIDLTKGETIQKGIELDVNYGLTTTCYDPAEDGTACGKCDACRLRLDGFEEAGVEDPVAYQ